MSQKKIAVYSEKGGVGKTTILASLASKMADITTAVFLDADASSQSLSDILKFYNLHPKIVYRDSICILPFLAEIHKNTEYFFVDLAGREATLNEIDYLKLIDVIIVPIPPIYSNYSTPVSTIEKLIKNGVDGLKIVVTMNYMWPAENLDAKVIQEFQNCVQLIAKKFDITLFNSSIRFSSSLNKSKSCLHAKGKYMQDIAKLAEFIKSRLI